MQGHPAYDIIDMLDEAGHSAYIVGGAVRDKLPKNVNLKQLRRQLTSRHLKACPPHGA